MTEKVSWLQKYHFSRRNWNY